MLDVYFTTSIGAIFVPTNLYLAVTVLFALCMALFKLLVIISPILSFAHTLKLYNFENITRTASTPYEAVAVFPNIQFVIRLTDKIELKIILD